MLATLGYVVKPRWGTDAPFLREFGTTEFAIPLDRVTGGRLRGGSRRGGRRGRIG